MGDPSAAELAYQRLKRGILEGSIPQGTLDLRRLGDCMRMSVTPVREALARLNAERLVTFAPHHGYTLTPPSAGRLESMYDLAAELAEAAVKRVRKPYRPLPISAAAASGKSYADRISALMAEIGSAQPNPEIEEQLIAVTGRLLAARRCEPIVIAQAEREEAALRTHWQSGSLANVRSALRLHFRERIGRADAIARVLTEQAGAR